MVAMAIEKYEIPATPAQRKTDVRRFVRQLVIGDAVSAGVIVAAALLSMKFIVLLGIIALVVITVFNGLKIRQLLTHQDQW